MELHRGRLPGDTYIRRPRLRPPGLRHVLGVPGLFSSAYGNVGSSIYYALGVTALFALGLTPAVFIFSGLIFACTALTYAEGATMIPEAGGSSTFARRGFSDFIGFIAGWALMLGYIVTIAISAFAAPGYLSFFWEPLGTWPLNSIFGVLIIAVLAGINVVGIRESSAVNILMALLDLASQAVLIIIGLFLILNIQTLISNVHLGEAPTWGNLLFGISISMIAYTGIETVSNLAEETRAPSRNIPKSVVLVFVAVITLFTFVSSLALSAQPVYFDETTGEWVTDLAKEWIDSPVLGIVQKMPEMLRPILGTWMAFLAANILVLATNAAILGLSRLTYSMGRHRLLPQALARIDEKRHTPTAAIVLFSIIAAAIILPGKLTALAELYSFSAILAFAFAHLSIIALRVKAPDVPRPFKIPFNWRFRGKDIPITAVIGLTGTLGTWLLVAATQEFGRNVGTVWIVAGIIGYWAYRREQGLSFWHEEEPGAAAAPSPAGARGPEAP